MLERYVEGFKPDRFLSDYMNTKKVCRTDALRQLRAKIPKESYYQDKIKKALKRRYADAFVVKIAQGAYSEAGIPDVMCIVNGHYFGFEIKRPVLGAPTKLQEMTIRRIRTAGGTAAIVTWPEECFRVIDKWIRR